MSIEASARRLENSVANSLYSDDSTVGGAATGARWTRSPLTDVDHLRPMTRATSASVCELGDPRPG